MDYKSVDSWARVVSVCLAVRCIVVCRVECGIRTGLGRELDSGFEPKTFYEDSTLFPMACGFAAPCSDGFRELLGRSGECRRRVASISSHQPPRFSAGDS